MNNDKVEVEEVPNLAQPRFVIKIVTYIDESGRRIQEKQIIEGEAPAGLCTFTGVGVMILEEQDHVRNFDIPGATTVREAIDLFMTFWNLILKQEGGENKFPILDIPPFVVRVDQLMDNNMQRVQEHVVIEGTPPSKYPRFHGAGIVRLPTQQEIIQEFVLGGAETVSQAFMLYPAVFNEVSRRVGIQFARAVAKEKERLAKLEHERQQKEHEEEKKKLAAHRAQKAPVGYQKPGLILP